MTDSGYVHVTCKLNMDVSFVFFRTVCNLISWFCEGTRLYFFNNSYGWQKHMTIFGHLLTKWRHPWPHFVNLRFLFSKAYFSFISGVISTIFANFHIKWLDFYSQNIYVMYRLYISYSYIKQRQWREIQGMTKLGHQTSLSTGTARWSGATGPCLRTEIWRCRKPFGQWQHSF